MTGAEEKAPDSKETAIYDRFFAIYHIGLSILVVL